MSIIFFKMIKKSTLLFVFCIEILVHNSLLCQSTFNVIPISPGQSNQSQLFDVYPDSNFIYVIGDLLDTTIDPLKPTVRPWWGVFDYNGELILKKVLYDTAIPGIITVQGSRILKNEGGNFVYATRYYENDDYSKCLLLEISHDGSILNSVAFKNPFDSLSGLGPRWIAKNPFQTNQYVLSTDMLMNQIQRGGIFLIDSQFQVNKAILIQDVGRNNAYTHIEVESDSSFIIIGDSRKRNDSSEEPDVKPFYLRTNLLGQILTFKLAQGIPDKTVGLFLYENYSIRRDCNGNWLFAGSSYFPGWYTFPYVFSYDSEFENMNWAMNFSPNKESTNEAYHILSGDFDSISQSFVCVGWDAFQPNGDTFIFKIRANGDSLWTRHFIPLNWKPEDIYYMDLEDVKVTPYQSYVSVGFAADQETRQWRSWAILVDSFGCIIPGCQNIVSSEEISIVSTELFSIYPNPASTFVGMVCNQDHFEKVRLSIFDLSGRMVESVIMSPAIGYQYLLDVSNWVGGMYFLRIDSIDGQLIQKAQIIVN